MRLPRRQEVLAATKVATASAAAVSTGYLAGTEAGIWESRPGWQVAAIVVVASLAVLASFGAAFGELRRAARSGRSEQIRAALEAAWFGVAEETGIDPQELLVSLFLIEGTFKKYLKRRIRVGVKQIPDSNVVWTKGKGVVGRCWEAEATQRRDLTQLNVSRGDCSAQQWANVAVDSNMQLSFEDWVKTRKKYDMIVAVPVQKAGEIIGCLAITGPTHNSTWITDTKVEQALVAAARTVVSQL